MQRNSAVDTFGLREVVRGVVEGHEAEARDKALQVRLQVHAGLAGFYRGDGDRVGQALSVLLAEAIGNTAQGTILVDVRPGMRDGEVWFMVSDTGAGIRAEAQSAVFESTGLAVVKKLARELRGQVGLDSEIGRGTRCWFHVPLEPLELPDTAGAAHAFGWGQVAAVKR
jgi:signal transduction histidine kinase